MIKQKTMNFKTVIIVFLMGGIFFSACQKNTDLFVPDPGQLNGPDTNWVSSITASMPVTQIKNNLLFEPYKDSIIVSSNISTVTTSFGVQLVFPPNCTISTTGQTLAGKTIIEIIQVKTKGDMVRLNLPTTSYDRLLVSGAQLFISLKNNGQVAVLAPNKKITIQYTDPNPNPLMNFFPGDESNAVKFNWLNNTDITNNYVNAILQSYEITTNHLRWISCAYLYDTTGITRVNVTANLAPYFTNANTTVFTVFKDFKSVVGMYGDVISRRFSSSKLPVGKAITVVVISKQGNDYYLGYQSTITSTNAPTSANHILSIVPIKRSLSDIIYYLKTL